MAEFDYLAKYSEFNMAFVPTVSISFLTDGIFFTLV